jgi:DNA-directed RNA polymerase specialized sigma24 family protein
VSRQSRKFIDKGNHWQLIENRWFRVVANRCATSKSATRQLTSEGFEAHNPVVSTLPVSFLRASQHSLMH